MSTGQGNVVFNSKKLPAGAPFTIGSAGNGLSVDFATGRIFLGGSQLEQNTVINMSTFNFDMTDGVGNHEIFIDNTNQVFQFGLAGTFLSGSDVPGGESITMRTNTARIDANNLAKSIAIGDTGNTGNHTVMTISDILQTVDIRNTALNARVRINNVLGFTGTVTPVVSITVNGGIVTNVT